MAIEERDDTLELTPERPRPEERGALASGWAGLKTTFKEAADYGALRRSPYGLRPAIVLAATALVATFDSTIFSLALPFIVRDLDIDFATVLQLTSVAGFFLIFAYLGLGYMLDRVRRVPFLAIGTMLQGVFSLVAWRSRSIVGLGVSRVFGNVSDATASIPYASLFADYYPVETRGRMFALYGVLVRGGRLVFPLAIGLMIREFGWRLPFVISGGLLVIMGALVLVTLKEPVRGYMERRALGMSEDESVEPEKPPSFGEGWRTIWGVRTLGRLFVGDAVAGIGERVYPIMFLAILVQEYNLDSFGIAKVIFVQGIFTFVGGFLGGGIVDSLIRRRPARVLVFTSTLGIINALLIPFYATTPPLWTVVAVGALSGFVGSLLGPARSVFITQITPAHIRSQGLTTFTLAGLPATIGATLLFGQIGDWGLTGVLAATTPFYLLGALVDLSAAPLFDRDMRAALASQKASQEYKRTKEAGATKLLVCRDIDVEYSGVQVLFGVDFDVEEGDIIALLGTNGAGKSTLLKAISGIQEASGGAVVFDGRDITHVPAYEITGRGVVHMPGGRGVFPGLTVRDNLVLGGWLNDDEAENKASLAECFEIFPQLKDRLDAKAGMLSGGEQQMVALAQAFLCRPRLLCIDELSLGLSPAAVQVLLEAVRAIHARGVTIIVVEQSVNVALTIAERAIFMEKGEVRFEGKTADLLNRPDIMRAVYVKGTGAVSSPGGRSGVRSERERRHDELQEARTVLKVEHLSKSFGGIHAVADVSFDLREGEILGLIGPNGSGKTTTFDLISGYQIPDAGRVVLEDRDVSKMGPDARSRLQMLRRFQDARLFPSLTVFETLLVALERHNEVRNLLLTSLQVPQVRASERRLRRRAELLIELLDLGAFRDKFVKELSTGLRRIVDLACVLGAEPKVLLLDEPSSGIAQAESEGLGPLLKRVRYETGCSILIIEHDMPLITGLADELVALDQGAVITRGTPNAVLNDPRVIESYLGTDESVIKRTGALT